MQANSAHTVSMYLFGDVLTCKMRSSHCSRPDQLELLNFRHQHYLRRWRFQWPRWHGRSIAACACWQGKARRVLASTCGCCELVTWIAVWHADIVFANQPRVAQCRTADILLIIAANLIILLVARVARIGTYVLNRLAPTHADCIANIQLDLQNVSSGTKQLRRHAG